MTVPMTVETKTLTPRPIKATKRTYNGPVRVDIVWIDPEFAEQLLLRNTHNRNYNEDVVGRIARDITEDDYQLNGETVKIADDGTIIDGQHRLWAIVKAGKGVWTVMVTGLPMHVQETVDRVKVRNIRDALTLRKEPNANILAGALAGAIVLQSGMPTDVAKVWPSIPQAMEYLEAHPEIRASLPIADQLSRTMRTSSTSAAALHHIFAKIDEEDANDFFAKLTSGADLPVDSPIYRLRDFMFKELQAQRRVPTIRLHAYYIKAWNAYRSGTPMLVLRWSTGGSHPEPFPTPE